MCREPTWRSNECLFCLALSWNAFLLMTATTLVFPFSLSARLSSLSSRGPGSSTGPSLCSLTTLKAGTTSSSSSSTSLSESLFGRPYVVTSSSKHFCFGAKQLRIGCKPSSGTWMPSKRCAHTSYDTLLLQSSPTKTCGSAGRCWRTWWRSFNR